MKFTTDRKSFLQLLQIVSPAVATRTTQQVLTGVLIECVGNAIKATAYDLDVGITGHLTEFTEVRTEVAREGNAVLPAKQLIDLTRKLTESELEIEVTSGDVIALRSGQFECGLHGMHGDMFPKLPMVSSESTVKIPLDVLKDLIRSTAFAASKSESRPVLTGVYIELNQMSICFSATDSLRLATRSVLLESPIVDPLTVIIPSNTLIELSHALTNDDGEVTISIKDSHCLFTTPSLQFYTRIIEGNFIDVRRLVPKTYITEVVVRTEALVRAIDRAMVIAPRNLEVHLTVEFGSIVIDTKSPEFGNLTDVVPTQSLQGESISVAVNAKNVLEALRSLPSEEMTLRMTGPNQPLVIMPKDDESFVHVISPLILRSSREQ